MKWIISLGSTTMLMLAIALAVAPILIQAPTVIQAIAGCTLILGFFPLAHNIHKKEWTPHLPHPISPHHTERYHPDPNK